MSLFTILKFLAFIIVITFTPLRNRKFMPLRNIKFTPLHNRKFTLLRNRKFTSLSNRKLFSIKRYILTVIYYIYVKRYDRCKILL